MDPATFLAHARALANSGTPAECRSAISRAYYAAYHGAGAFLLGLRVVIPVTGRAHSLTFNCLLSVPAVLDTPIREAGVELSELHSERHDADYRWNDPRTEVQLHAQSIVDRAEAVLLALTTCQADAARLTALEGHFRSWVPTIGGRLGLALLP
jgi:uncharacterized protein (UPF0332 family)